MSYWCAHLRASTSAVCSPETSSCSPPWPRSVWIHDLQLSPYQGVTNVPVSQACPRARCAREIAGSLSIAGSARDSLLRRLAVLEVGMAQGHQLEHYLGAIPHGVSRSTASATARRGYRSRWRAFLPGSSIPGSIQPRRCARSLLCQRHGGHFLSSGAAGRGVRGRPGAARALGLHALDPGGLRTGPIRPRSMGGSAPGSPMSTVPCGSSGSGSSLSERARTHTTTD